ncbi:hypothetical protein [Singulisphaera sp. PoT]|uniref:hypothetical protein n=1 Tax=Singulisphaera sp. PoT TaxID=3411797 RepID=UPI003BF4C70C
MKSLLASAVILGLTMGFVGCGEEAKKETTVETPGGTTTTTESVKKTGDNPPPADAKPVEAPK